MTYLRKSIKICEVIRLDLQLKSSYISLIQSDGGTKDLRSHGNPGKPEGANLSEQSNNKRIDDEISGQSFGADL